MTRSILNYWIINSYLPSATNAMNVVILQRIVKKTMHKLYWNLKRKTIEESQQPQMAKKGDNQLAS